MSQKIPKCAFFYVFGAQSDLKFFGQIEPKTFPRAKIFLKTLTALIYTQKFRMGLPDHLETKLVKIKLLEDPELPQKPF